MATENITITGEWSVAHTAASENTNVVLTPAGPNVEWAIDTTVPAATLVGHQLSEPLLRSPEKFRDRGFVLKNGEGLYVRGPRDAVVARTVAA